MMFGHLKAENFINQIDGDGLSARLRTHLQKCRKCMDALASAQALHLEMTQAAVSEDDIPEPDWSQFRQDVRNTMLSRAAQRQPKAGWSGWLRPAMTWGLAVAFAAGLGAGVLILNQHGSNPATNSEMASGGTETLPLAVKPADIANGSSAPSRAEVATEPLAFDSGPATWSQTSVFEQLSQLSDAQAEKLQRLLEAEAHQAPSRQ